MELGISFAVPETENMGSSLHEGPEHELPSGGGSLRRCMGGGRDREGCKGEGRLGATAVITGGVDAVRPRGDEFDVVDKDKERMEGLGSFPCNDNAALLDIGDGTGAPLPVCNETGFGNEGGLGVEEGEGRFSALEGDPPVGARNKHPAEETDSVYPLPSSTAVGCEVEDLSHVVTRIEDGVCHFEGAGPLGLSDVTRVEGGVACFDRDEDHTESEVAIARDSRPVTDCCSINCSSELVEGFPINFAPQDYMVTSISSGIEVMDETCKNSSELAQTANRKDNAEVPCVMGNSLELAPWKPSVDTSHKQIGGEEVYAPSVSEENDTCGLGLIPSEEREAVGLVHFENEMYQASLIERGTRVPVQGLPGTEIYSCTKKELALLQPSYLGNALEKCPPCLASVSDCKGDALAISVSSTGSDSAANCCTQAYNGGKDDLMSGSVSFVRRRNPKRAASSRNNQSITKSDPLTRMRGSAKKRKHAVSICASVSRGPIRRITKKRCHSWKRERISVWGALETLLQLFKHNDEFSEPKNKGSKKVRCSGVRKKRSTDRRAGTSCRPRAKLTISDESVVVQKEMDQQVTLAAASCLSPHTDPNDYSHSSDILILQGLSKAVTGIEIISETGSFCDILHSCHSKDIENQVMYREQHSQHGDKEPESGITQEASVENSGSDCHGVQSRVEQEALLEAADGNLLLDPGMSPDSGVLHPTADTGHVTIEGATSRSNEPSSKAGVMAQNIFESGSPVQENLHSTLLMFPQVTVSVSLQSIQQQTHNRRARRSGKTHGKKNCKVEEDGCLSSDNSFEGTSQDPSSLIQAEKSSRNMSSRRKKDGSSHKKVINQRSNGKASEAMQKCDGFPAEHSLLGITEEACCQSSFTLDNCLENHALSATDAEIAYSESTSPKNLSSSSTDKGQKLHRGTKADTRKSKSRKSDSAQHKGQNGKTRKKDKVNNLTASRKSRQKMLHGQVTFVEECRTHDAFHVEQGGLSHTPSGIKKSLTSKKPGESDEVNVIPSDQLRDVDGSDSGNKLLSKHALSSLVATINDDLATEGSNHVSEGQNLPKRAAWVRCDDCHKWRSIPVQLADIIDETNRRWTCKDNGDKAFADCIIPQEKTNAQINAELEISDASCEEDSFSERPNLKGSEMKPAAAQQSSWVCIKSNMFLHRTRKTQTIDEIMVCQCKRRLDGGLGCQDECLNRMLNIECVPGTCPCGNLCSNQQFQKQKYARFKWFRCGKKGFGLQLLENVSQGQFLIEYVGEVLDLVAYEARQREYASRGQKHFYFMTLNVNEVIDACAKGNLGRFINHSCAPNCRTEKWMVNGEVCIGLFAMRDIKKGEEVTFDYNYVRVFGAAAKRCVCGSIECRGYIGGDPLNSESIVQGDSDEEYPEPVMISEDGETELDIDETVPEFSDATDPIDDFSIQSTGEASRRSVVGSKVDVTLPILCSSDAQLSETLSLESKSKKASDPIPDGNKCVPHTGDESLHASRSPQTKSSRSVCSIKKKSCSSSKSVMQKAKKQSATLAQPAVCRTGHFEGVEEKLNELLDGCGGISKRRDATKGYLKLLFLTAASGDNVKSETSQSTRDLSLILEALLKTKSRTVLVDIINKNGLQMLHNIMKQNRKNFHKIPILRKLLKVLEFLAGKEILTPEHISSIPSHAGVESFRESIIKLTYHSDTQVHQMARNFRDKWLPRTIKKVYLSDRENGWLHSKRANSNWFLPSSLRRQVQDVRDTDAICVSRADHLPSPSHGTDAPSEISSFCSELASTSAPAVDMNSIAVAKPRKRKTRWDQPSDATYLDSQISSIEEHTTGAISKIMRVTATRTESHPHCTSKAEREVISCSGGTVSSNGLKLQQIEEVPPGFGPAGSNSQLQIQSDTSMVCTEAVAGHPQERYRPLLSISYGIPLTLVEQLGTADAEAGDNWRHRSWAIAPGMPFHPFPPLPPLPRGDTNPAPRDHTIVEEGSDETRPPHSTRSKADSIAIVSAGRPSVAAENGAVNQQLAEKMSWSPNDIGKRFSRPDKWNDRRYEKFGPPWPRESSCRFRGSVRHGMSSIDVGSIQKMGHDLCFSQGVKVENVSSTFR